MHVMMHAYLHICTCFRVCVYMLMCAGVYVCMCVCVYIQHRCMFFSFPIISPYGTAKLPLHLDSSVKLYSTYPTHPCCAQGVLAEGLEVLVHRRWELAPRQRPPAAVTVNCARLCQDHLPPGCPIVGSAGSAVLPCPQPRASSDPIPAPPCPSSSTSHAPDLVIL